MKQQRLELTWIGKDERPRLEPRILVEDRAKGHRAAVHRGGDLFDNMMVQGDNLLALKALEADYAGKVKCVFIDPPYNTGSAFTHYDDGLEHSLWLTMMRNRLELIHRLLSEDGSMWVTLDDNEAHYFKVMCDEIFGRQNFVANITWQKRFSPNSTAHFISDSHDHVLLYGKNKQRLTRKLLPRDDSQNKSYRNPDNDSRGTWTSGDLSARNSYSAGIYPISTPSGRIIPGPPKGMYWRVSERKLKELDDDNRIWWGSDKNNIPRLKRFLSEVLDGIVAQTIWLHTEVGNNQEAKKEVMAVVSDEALVFSTPKPERLIKRVLDLATEPGDLVLDSFAGSGTTGAVAQKMGRRWIMVELGDHAITHIVPRLTKVIDGQDPGGVTEATGWQGGGGFRFFHLAPSLLRQDRYGQWVISPVYRPEMLSEAVCKLLGFTYAPSSDAATYWRHGHSTETDFIFVTTQAMTYETLAKLSDEVGEGRTLLVACRAYAAKTDAFPNLTMKKIPHAVLTRCEWDRDDYSLTVPNGPNVDYDVRDVEADISEAKPLPAKSKRGRPSVASSETPSLFGEDK